MERSEKLSQGSTESEIFDSIWDGAAGMFDDTFDDDATTATTTTASGLTTYRTSRSDGTGRQSSLSNRSENSGTTSTTDQVVTEIASNLTSHEEDEYSKSSKSKRSSTNRKSQESDAVSFDSDQDDQLGQNRGSIRDLLKERHSRLGAIVASEQEVNTDEITNQDKKETSKTSQEKNLAPDDIVPLEKVVEKKRKKSRGSVDFSNFASEENVGRPKEKAENQELHTMVEDAVNHIENLLASNISQGKSVKTITKEKEETSTKQKKGSKASVEDLEEAPKKQRKSSEESEETPKKLRKSSKVSNKEKEEIPNQQKKSIGQKSSSARGSQETTDDITTDILEDERDKTKDNQTIQTVVEDAVTQIENMLEFNISQKKSSKLKASDEEVQETQKKRRKRTNKRSSLESVSHITHDENTTAIVSSGTDDEANQPLKVEKKVKKKKKRKSKKRISSMDNSI